MKRLKSSWNNWRTAHRSIREKRRTLHRVFGLLLLGWYLTCLPEQLFDAPTSTVLLDRDGELLGAHIAPDGQWRFPETTTVPPKMATCMIAFEDRNFYSHVGISAKGIVRAIVQNSKKGKVVSGGSTITMQVIRIMRHNPPRTYSEKLYEMILATRLEWRCSKDEILALYASHAPFGNNVVGMDAAAWRYFGRSAAKLSWAESATLAVLPNAPGLIYPGKNHSRLLEKRNRLLRQLYDDGTLDAVTYELSLSEPLPDKPLALPKLAPHVLNQCIREGQKGTIIHSTIRQSIQEKAIQQLRQHHLTLRENNIMNGAVIITDVNTGEIVAYVGNTEVEAAEYAPDVNCANGCRSTGSILKPLLYARCLDDGLITPKMLVSDIPSQFGAFSPKNYTGLFDGAVPADQALSRSLNIPMVHLLGKYGVARFKDNLRHFGLTTIKRPARHYGLSLILGGSEAKLTELNAVYTHLAQELKFGKQLPIQLTTDKPTSLPRDMRATTSRGAIYSTFEAMIEVNRPDEDNHWRDFSSSQPIAWKTGTSFGFRDGWAIGITPDYVVSVWIGNADGEGRPGLTGVKAAAPLMFDLFRQLPRSRQWFQSPKGEMTSMKICPESGHRATDLCTSAKWASVPKSCVQTAPCPYHQVIHLDKSQSYRVDSDCESVYNMTHKSWFVLPVMVEKYYKFNHPNYKPLPDYKPECLAMLQEKTLHIMYPKPKGKLYIPVEINGNPGKVILEASHRNPTTTLYWHLDDQFIGQTKEIHQLAVHPDGGQHKLTVVDENGVSVTVGFEVIGRK